MGREARTKYNKLIIKLRQLKKFQQQRNKLLLIVCYERPEAISSKPVNTREIAPEAISQNKQKSVQTSVKELIMIFFQALVIRS